MPKCPKCHLELSVHPDEGYYGEMFQCLGCGFMAYCDMWDESGQYIRDSDDPF
jgi:hypothetical protein